MTKTIAMAGKGGTGKTTVAALLTRALLQRGNSPILAIDADPATNLHLALGLPEPATVGDLREGMRAEAGAGSLGVSISRQDYLNREVRLALEEGDQVDLIAMGRPEGQGCYCAVNHLLRQILDDLGKTYAWVIIDNEAGMEHISRRTTRDVDLLLVVTDPTVRGLRTAQSIATMSDDVEVNVRRKLLIVNRLPDPVPPEFEKALAESGLEIGARIPADPLVGDLDARGQSLLRLNGTSPACAAIESLADRILQDP
ncbi:MAG TPA: AAA family ATPase [Anaerolineales bacterium]|nr:AAA family ATPase [Anaerolineales bacterium]